MAIHSLPQNSIPCRRMARIRVSPVRRSLCITWLALAPLTVWPAAGRADGTGIRERLSDEAKAFVPLVETDFGRRFLNATSLLRPPAAQLVYRNSRTRTYLAPTDFEKLAEAEKGNFTPVQIDESAYYLGRYGTPLAYARCIDLAAAAGALKTPRPRILDFGYGSVGHLEMLAGMGVDAVGVDVDPLLPILYSAANNRPSSATTGSLKLFHGRFPGDDSLRRQVGANFDLFLSKNTLKNGYIHPAEKVDPRMTIDLGVSDEAFVRAMRAVLKPGGFVMIYNLCPAPAPPGKPYIPWADGRCPFSRGNLENAGFRIIEFDRDDSTFARKLGEAAGWNKPPLKMDLEKDLFAWYTLLQCRE